MKKCSSLKSKKLRHPDCILIKRKGVCMIINKKYPKYKVKQG